MSVHALERTLQRTSRLIQTLFGRRNALAAVGALGAQVWSQRGTGVVCGTETRTGGAGAVGTALVAISDELSGAGRESGAVVRRGDTLSGGAEEGSSHGTEVGRAILSRLCALVEVAAEEGRDGVDLEELDVDIVERVGVGDVEGGQRNGTAGLRHHAEAVGAALEGSWTEGADAAVRQTLHAASVAALIVFRAAVDVESSVESDRVDQSVLLLAFRFRCHAETVWTLEGEKEGAVDLWTLTRS